MKAEVIRRLKLPQESRIYGIKDLWIKRLVGTFMVHG